MRPGPIEGSNATCGAPKNWDAEKDGPCGALEVRVATPNLYQSAWYPSPDEIKALIQGAYVVLTVVGGQPPVRLDVEPSPEELAHDIPS